MKNYLPFFALAGCLLMQSCTNEQIEPAPLPTPENSPSDPGWVADAVFYQIFPTRFRNGDPSNDPTHASLEFPENVPASWKPSSWTADWYARDAWEKERGEDFYEDGVFDRRYGGDLQGVIDKLDYLKDLGINTIYFNPVFYARSLHKYDGNTFHHIDPYFGPDPDGDFALMAQETSDPATWHVTAADQLFFDLIQDAHSKGIRIIIDGVWNHTGRDFFAFDDIRQNQEASPYKDWYIVQSFDNPDTPENEFAYEGWWGVETLPLFADTPDSTDLHPGPKKYIFDSTSRWMDPNGDGNPIDGIDGWRLDVATDVPVKFWADWNAHVRSINDEAYTVSEVWHDASDFLVEGGFSATMNYHAFAFPVKGFLIDNLIPATDFLGALESRRQAYSTQMQFGLQNLIDSHDTDRLASMIVNAKPVFDQPDRFDFDHNVSPRYYEPYEVRKPNERERKIQKLVALMQMTSLGAPMIYYGTEAGMWGADDPDDRMPMIWEDLVYDDQILDPGGRERPQDKVAFDQGIFDFYQSVIQLRHDNLVLRRGEFIPLNADDEANSILFARFYEDDIMIAGLNRSDQAQQIVLPDAFALRDKTLHVVFSTTGEGADQVIPYNTDREVTLPPLTGIVLTASSEDGQ